MIIFIILYSVFKFVLDFVNYSLNRIERYTFNYLFCLLKRWFIIVYISIVILIYSGKIK